MESGKVGRFGDAFSNPGNQFRVEGYLVKSEDIIYEPLNDPSLTKFTMRDQDGVIKEVHLKKSKPQGFEQSESLVLIGKAEGDVFHAADMQMKCPSKYNEEKHKLHEASI
jgi:cytochrome c-type biogenesis protein CcmE